VRFRPASNLTLARSIATLINSNASGSSGAFHTYKLFFLGEVDGGAASGSMETGGAEFFAKDNLPPLSLTRVMPNQIAHLFEHYRHPELPTSFD
jgi:hypothetical protein